MLVLVGERRVSRATPGAVSAYHNNRDYPVRRTHVGWDHYDLPMSGTGSRASKSSPPSRTPPKAVRDRLCREVGFGCPIPGCGSPFLTFHHFDPPWRVKRHHNPEGMIALCAEHAGLADGGRYSNEFLTSIKVATDVRDEHRIDLNYMRRDVVAMVGSNAFYNTSWLLKINGEKVIYFDRDPDGYLLLNIKLLGIDGKPRLHLEDNVWLIQRAVENIECRAQGRSLTVRFANGDSFSMAYKEAPSLEELEKRCPGATRALADEDLEFPILVATFHERTTASSFVLGKEYSFFGAQALMRNSWAVGGSGLASVSGPTVELDKRDLATVQAAIAWFDAQKRRRK